MASEKTRLKIREARKMAAAVAAIRKAAAALGEAAKLAERRRDFPTVGSLSYYRGQLDGILGDQETGLALLTELVKGELKAEGVTA